MHTSNVVGLAFVALTWNSDTVNSFSIHVFHSTSLIRAQQCLPALNFSSKRKEQVEDPTFEELVGDLLDDLDELGELDPSESDDEDKTEQSTGRDTSDLQVSADDSEPLSEEEELFEFLDMLDDSPVGSLGKDELLLLRETIESIYTSLSSEQGIDEAVAGAAEELLRRLVTEWKSAVKENPDDPAQLIEPTDKDFLNIYRLWESVAGDENDDNLNKVALPNVIERVSKAFRTQKNLFQQGLATVEPSSETYETVLRVLGASREKGGDRTVLSVFDEAPVKTSSMYGTAVRSTAKSRDRGAAKRAEELLREAVEKFPPSLANKKQSGMTIDSFNVVLTAWAKSGLAYGPERAEKLIVFMDEVDKENGSLGFVSPNIFSFTSLIDAYTQEGDWDGAAQSERILRSLLDQYLAGEEGIPEPSVASWTIVISAWTRLSKKGNRGAPDKAGRLLELMEKLHGERKIGFGPDAIVYVTCLNAFGFSKIKEGPAKAEEILDKMHEFYLDGDETMKPSAKSIRIVTNAWINSESPDAMEEAELFLERYEDLLFSLGPPTEPIGVLDEIKDIYKAMMFGFARRGFPVQAQQYLRTMIDKGMNPDCFCYDKVIEANTLLNDDKAFSRSYQVFEIMEVQRKAGQMKPNERVYTSFIRAMTKARVPNLAHKANMILKRMDNLYNEGNKHIQPTVFAYNAVLMACAETLSATQEPEVIADAFRIAIEVFNDLRIKEGPDHVSFGNMLRCAKLLPDGDQKNSVIKSTFGLCCRAGFVNDFIIRDLQLSAPEDLWRSLLKLPRGEVNVERLPQEWQYRFEKRKRKPSVPTY